jgi:hypothetical protein
VLCCSVICVLVLPDPHLRHQKVPSKAGLCSNYQRWCVVWIYWYNTVCYGRSGDRSPPRT